MKSQWDDREAQSFGDDPLGLRVYTSRLIGRESDLVLHGGGNTSVKATVSDVFGDEVEVLHVKGSGWDLATIEREGFAPVRLDVLRRMAELESLSDAEMVRVQRAAMTDPNAPAPSVEAILHAIIPMRFVDHTHADAVVTITNTEGGLERIGEIYGDSVFIVPYVMPGFDLAREVYKMTRDIDWHQIEGMILLNHGVFTFGDDARSSYERMIAIVTEAERYLEENAPAEPASSSPPELDAEAAVRLATLRQAVSDAAGAPMVARLDDGDLAAGFASLPEVASLATRGPLTPDHVIRTKRTALILTGDPEADVEGYAADYRAYFDRNDDGSHTCLDPAPRWAVWPGRGVVSFGRSDKDAGVVSDIKDHTIAAIQKAEELGGWHTLGEDEIFDVEYWELEQAKLARAAEPPEFAGKVALVTGAASGIGRASALALVEAGACVAALDIDPAVSGAITGTATLPLVCDVTDEGALGRAVEAAVARFGGLDVVVSNAGVFPGSAPIAETPREVWEKSLAVNLTSHRSLIEKTAPYLALGIDPAVVVIGSKNVAAPGPGASAYSVAKAGLTQLCRVAALELAAVGVRVNVVHPNDVFDTAIWTDEVLSTRAAHYGMSVDEYKRKNLLGVEIRSADVAALVCAVAGRAFARTTGAQISIDGGNDRVI
jgi:rhamnose utilization protein RhaD (predicted bifunctional aldolase and dehydrogenase)/NAD(P)-dependent dehydrogenase (short-subunit alcohol dehydrogenase family)